MATSQLHLPDLKADCFLGILPQISFYSNFLSGQAFTIVGLTHSKKQSTRYRVELSLSDHANIVSGQVTARDSAPVFKNNGQIN
ncbi:unnamed protein product [Brassica oleracea]